ncbi:MAG TPA: beta-propeller domain-containing protein, partial [Methylomirabilota bacterium]|nr:beta-propeller domain-containing protein [Methylomirabilota bacterium]
MKNLRSLINPAVCARCLLPVLLFLGAPSLSADPAQPVIVDIQIDGTNAVVTTDIPPGILRVVLESRAHLGEGAWIPVAVQRTDGQGTLLTFTVPRSNQIELLRVRAQDHESLPRIFFDGPREFFGPNTGGPEGVPVFLGPDDGIDRTGAPVAGENNGGDSREVVESDIWKRDGDTLYFFNQRRGLQVIDVANPDQSFVRGMLDLPAAGEELYLLDSHHVALLARDHCGWIGPSGQSRLMVVNAEGDSPEIIAELPVDGHIVESRLVGSALYLASQAYQPVADDSGSSWQWGILVTSFDLSDPAQPLLRDTLWYPGSGGVVSATDVYLFVAMQTQNDWWRSVVHLIDITAPDGGMKEYDSITTAGRVNDKFKLNYVDTVFTAISLTSEHRNGRTVPVTTLETFRVPHPASAGPAGITRLGSLELAAGEQLFATRFDGDLVYLVTFLQIDPLWVVDISDPENPTIHGELEVPGWSTYIHPLGDRLLTMGVETNQAAVSLFDVSDVNNPSLLGRVLLGEGSSWSEANQTEKAFSVLEDAGLVLVPFQSYTPSGYVARVQLIDLEDQSLTARGVIHHQFEARRNLLHRDRVLSLSGAELLSVDVTDRDAPEVTGQLPLAWPVNRVLLSGDFLLEIADGNGWRASQGAAAIRVATASDPGLILNQFQLNNALPIVGATVRDQSLIIAQAVTTTITIWLPPTEPTPSEPEPGESEPPETPEEPTPTLFLTVLDLGALPDLSVRATVPLTLDSLGWAPSLRPLWLNDNLLVWSVEGGSHYYILPWLDFGDPWLGRPIAGDFWAPWYPGGGGRLLAFDVSDPGDPSFLSDVNLTRNNWWSFSSAFASDGRIYLSHQASEFLPHTTPDADQDPNPDSGDTGEGIWIQKHFLDVIDFADPANPTVRKPLNIPGQLRGISHGGSLLYTIGYHWDRETFTSDWREWLDASAYDE